MALAVSGRSARRALCAVRGVRRAGALCGLPCRVDGVLVAEGLTIRHAETGTPSTIDLSGVEGLVVLSGPTSPDLAEGSLLQAAIAAAVPVLALGPGARHLATPHGRGTKGPATSSARGRVSLTTSADLDPLFTGGGPLPELPPAAAPFAAPPDAVTLAACDGSTQQAFRLGNSAWGVRFLTTALLDPWGEALLRRFAALVTARAEHTATRAFFTHRAEDWEERFAYQAPAYEAAVARMKLEPGGLALDLGCGTGRAMPALRKQVGPTGQVVGIDVTPAMLASAARHARDHHGHLLAADCNRLPLSDRSVYGIFTAGLLDHLPAPRTTLLEWARVGTPGAVLLLFHPSGRAERAACHATTAPSTPTTCLRRRTCAPRWK